VKNQKINFDDYLEKKLKDPTFRELFLQQRDALRLGIEIARLRQQVGISQNELARRAGMHKQNIARLERPDYRGFTLGTLERIALALDHRLEIRFVNEEMSKPGFARGQAARA